MKTLSQTLEWQVAIGSALGRLWPEDEALPARPRALDDDEDLDADDEDDEDYLVDEEDEDEADDDLEEEEFEDDDLDEDDDEDVDEEL